MGIQRTSDTFVTVMRFTYAPELAVLRAAEAEGIECLVLNELTTQMLPFYSNAVGGIQLQVKESDVERAMDILKGGGYINHESSASPEVFTEQDTAGDPVPFDTVATQKNALIACSNCGSTNVSRPRLSAQAFAISLLLLGFPLPFRSKIYHCYNCGKDFRKKDGQSY